MCAYIYKVYKHEYIYIYMGEMIKYVGDGRSRYNRMVKLLKPLVGETMHIDKIRRKIIINIGTSEKLIGDTLKFMIDTGLIVERDHLIFEVLMAELEE